MRVLTSLVLASSLLACADDQREELELPETLVDGAADTWAYPTAFGALHEGIWQRGELVPESNRRFPAWEFELDDKAMVALTTRSAPAEEHSVDLWATVIYLYKQRDAGTWQRIARTAAIDDFGTLMRSLDAGSYRVIVKGLDTDDAGEFMLRRECDDAGCIEGPQCLFGDNFNEVTDVRFGALLDYGSTTLTKDSDMHDALKAQIIAAVNESTHVVSTIAEAFDAVDGNTINRYRLYDDLAGRSMVAIEYGAGDNSYGAIFVEDSATPAAGIHDGYIEGCTIPPQACVFGRSMYEAAYMPGMTSTAYRDHTSPNSVDAMTEKQILATMQVPTLAEAFNVDDGSIYVERYTHDDGRTFVEIRYHAGDTPVGAFFREGSDVILATNSDGDIYGCTEF